MFKSLKGLMKTMITDVRNDIRSVGGQVEAATAMATDAKHSADKAVADVADLKKEVEEITGPGVVTWWPGIWGVPPGASWRRVAASRSPRS